MRVRTLALVWPETLMHFYQLSCALVDFERTQIFDECRWCFLSFSPSRWQSMRIDESSRLMRANFYHCFVQGLKGRDDVHITVAYSPFVQLSILNLHLINQELDCSVSTATICDKTSWNKRISCLFHKCPELQAGKNILSSSPPTRCCFLRAVRQALFWTQ